MGEKFVIGDIITAIGSDTTRYKVSTIAYDSGSTGAATVIALPEGMGNPFNIDDVLTISGITGVTGFNTTAKVLSIEEPRLQGGSAIGVFNTKLTVDHDSRALNSDNAVTTTGQLRRTLTVAARTDSGAGKMYVQQVQISGVQ